LVSNSIVFFAKKYYDAMGGGAKNAVHRKNLQVHHLVKRSQLGDDAEGNLITLCAICHRKYNGG